MKCMHCPINSIYFSLPVFNFLLEAIVLGFWNFACAPKSQNFRKNSETISSPLHYAVFGWTKGGFLKGDAWRWLCRHVQRKMGERGTSIFYVWIYKLSQMGSSNLSPIVPLLIMCLIFCMSKNTYLRIFCNTLFKGLVQRSMLFQTDRLMID